MEDEFIVNEKNELGCIYDFGLISPKKEIIIKFLNELYKTRYEKPEEWESKINKFFSEELFVIYVVASYTEDFKKDLDEDKFQQDIINEFIGTLIHGHCIMWDSNQCYKELIKIKDSISTGVKINKYSKYFFVNNFIIRKMNIKCVDEDDSRFNNYGLSVKPFYYKIGDKDDKKSIYETTLLFLPDKEIDYPLEKWRKEISNKWKDKLKNLTNTKKKKNKRNPIDSRLRHEVFKRDNYACKECGQTKKESILHCDHIIPVSQGGTDELDNLQILCAECNLAKSDKCFIGGNDVNIKIKQEEVK